MPEKRRYNVAFATIVVVKIQYRNPQGPSLIYPGFCESVLYGFIGLVGALWGSTLRIFGFWWVSVFERL